MLMAFAPPAASAPPTRVASMRPIDGRPRFATTMVGSVVTKRSSMMRGLVKATYALMVDHPARVPWRAGACEDIGLSLRRGPRS